MTRANDPTPPGCHKLRYCCDWPASSNTQHSPWHHTHRLLGSGWILFPAGDGGGRATWNSHHAVLAVDVLFSSSRFPGASRTRLGLAGSWQTTSRLARAQWRATQREIHRLHNGSPSDWINSPSGRPATGCQSTHTVQRALWDVGSPTPADGRWQATAGEPGQLWQAAPAGLPVATRRRLRCIFD